MVYVHGICKHSAGYSNGWWDALHPFTNAFGAGELNDTRQEVLWSDLVCERRLVSRQAGLAEDGQAEWAARIRGVLEDRAATHALETGPAITSPELVRDLLIREMQARDIVTRDVSVSVGLNIPGIDCVEDFAVYMFNDSVRARSSVVSRTWSGRCWRLVMSWTSSVIAGARWLPTRHCASWRTPA